MPTPQQAPTTGSTETPVNPFKKKLEEDQAQQRGNHLMLRNVLNAVFMLMALVAMVGIVASPQGSTLIMVWYGLGLVAVLVKMVEVMLRVPFMKRR